MLPKFKSCLSVKKEVKNNASVQALLNLKTSTAKAVNAIVHSPLHSNIRPNAPFVINEQLRNKLFETAIGAGLSKKNAQTFAKTSLKRLKAIKYNWPPKRIATTGITTQDCPKFNPNLIANLPMENNYNAQNASSDLIKLGFISTNGAPLLTIEDMVRIQDAILEVIVTHSTPPHKAQFEACVLQNEWLQVECANNNAAEWVRKNFELIRSRSTLNIELLEEHQFPRHCIEGYFPNSEHLSDTKVLAFVNAQNTLSTRLWRVVERAVNGNMLVLTIVIDDASMQSLTFCGGNISYRFGRINLNINGSGIKNVAATPQNFWSDEPWTQFAQPSQLFPASLGCQNHSVNEANWNLPLLIGDICNAYSMNFSLPSTPNWQTQYRWHNNGRNSIVPRI